MVVKNPIVNPHAPPTVIINQKYKSSNPAQFCKFGTSLLNTNIGTKRIVAYTLLAYESAQISPFSFGSTFLVKIEYKERDIEPKIPKTKPPSDKLPEIK